MRLFDCFRLLGSHGRHHKLFFNSWAFWRRSGGWCRSGFRHRSGFWYRNRFWCQFNDWFLRSHHWSQHNRILYGWRFRLLHLRLLGTLHLHLILRNQIGDVCLIAGRLGLIGNGDLMTTVLLVISQESIEDTTGILALSSFGVHIVLLVACRDETKLYQTTRHRGETEYGQVILLGTHILTTCCLTDITLHIFRQFDTVLHILILDELKHDVALRRIRIVALISLFVVLLQQDYSILTLSHFQILLYTVSLTSTFARTEGIGLETSGNPASGHSVDMNGNKKVGFIVVGNLSTTVKLHETVCLTGIDHLYIWTVALDHLSESEGELQRQVLLLRNGSDGTCIISTVSRIDDQRELLIGSIDHHGSTEQQ